MSNLQRLLLVLAGCSLVGTSFIYLRPARWDLSLTSEASGGHLFYDAGKGFVEEDSAVAAVRSDSSISFPLPAKTLSGFRFNALSSEGSLTIRRVEIRLHGKIWRQIATSHITPSLDHLSFLISLDEPVALDKVTRRKRRQQAIAVNGCLLGVLILILAVRHVVVYGFKGQVAAALAWHRSLDVFARRLTSGRFLALDATAVWIYALLACVFVVASALDLNGSSEGMYSLTPHHGPPDKPWIGAARAVRSDEWGYVTPDILHQYFRRNRFAVEESGLGNHYIGLAGNLPVRDVTTLFRPQFWPFFVLPADYAYSMWWQAKALLLVGGMFTFLLWITKSSGWAISGALWYFFSGFTQWTYSWASALPEMIGLACLSTVFFCYLTVGQQAWKLGIAALGATLCAVNFALCAYLPQLIPLAWVAVTMGAAWCITARKAIWQQEKPWLRIGILSLVALVLAGVGWRVHDELSFAIAALAHTSYPGQRSVAGGSLPIYYFGSHFLEWSVSEDQFPAQLMNISEGCGFLWLAPITLLCLPRVALSSFQKASMVALGSCFLLLFCWAVMPLPVAFGRVFGLNLVMMGRLLPALGLANVGIVAIAAARRRGGTGPALHKTSKIRMAAYLVIWFVIWLSLLWVTNSKLNGFFSDTVMLCSSAFLALLCVLLVSGKSRALAACLVASQVIAFGRVNPVVRGLPVLTKSALHDFVQSHRELLSGKWLVYSDSPFDSGFFAAAGCSVYTGLRYVPDVDHFSLFVARGLDLNEIDRLGWVVAQPLPAGQTTRFVRNNPVILDWKVAANDPMLRELGIRYVAFETKPVAELSVGLTAITEQPVNGFWIYEEAW